MGGGEARAEYLPPHAAAMDQHAFHWCGACYIVAAVQTIEDRANRLRAAQGKAPLRLAVQAVLDHFHARHAPREEPGWNACHGGFTEDVVECLCEGSCPLELQGRATAYRGVVRTDRRTRGRSAPVRVGAMRPLCQASVREALLKHGPVLLYVAAEVLFTTERGTGRVAWTGMAAPPTDHVVSVVGWRGDCWIVRNSWGALRPAAVPDDLPSCNRVNDNRCAVARVPWHSIPALPGHCLLPMGYPGLHPRDEEGPFFDIEVSLS